MVRFDADVCANFGARMVMKSFKLERTAFAPLLRCRRRLVVNRLAGEMRSSRRVVPGPGWEVMSLKSFMTVIAEAAGSFVMFCGQVVADGVRIGGIAVMPVGFRLVLLV